MKVALWEKAIAKCKVVIKARIMDDSGFRLYLGVVGFTNLGGKDYWRSGS